MNRGPGVVELHRAGPLKGSVVAPGSKSHTNRALVVAALAAGSSRLRHPLAAEDVDRMVGGLRAMGAEVGQDGSDLVVAGTGGHLRGGTMVVDAGLSGTTLRFLTAVATLSPGLVTLTGAPPLLARPVGPLTGALRAMGSVLADREGRPPVLVSGGRPRGGRVVVDARASSQFVTSLLLIGPYCQEDLEVVPAGLGARGYVEMTVSLMRRWGAEVSTGGAQDALVVRGRQPYRGRQEDIAGDASAAAHLFALAVATGGEVRVANLGGATTQPDFALLDVLVEMGARWHWDGPDSVVVVGPERLAPVHASLEGLPDQLPTVAVLAALAPGRSAVTGVAVTRHHETDRVAAVAAELAKVGIRTEVGEDSLVVHGGAPLATPALIQTYHDHRMAMAFAALAGRGSDIAIADPDCVAKTYPRFWEDARQLGLHGERR